MSKSVSTILDSGLEKFKVLKLLKYSGISMGVCLISILTLNFEYLGSSYSHRTIPQVKLNKQQPKENLNKNNSDLAINSLDLTESLPTYLIVSAKLDNEKDASKMISQLHNKGFEQAFYYKKNTREFLVCLQDTYSKESAIMLKHKYEALNKKALLLYKVSNPS